MMDVKRVESVQIEKDDAEIWRWSAMVDGWKQSGALCCGEDAGDDELRAALPAWIRVGGAGAHVERRVMPVGRWLQFRTWVAG